MSQEGAGAAGVDVADSSDWRKTKQSIPEMMSYLFTTGLHSDMSFVVGPEKKRYDAHKFVVMGRSEVFEVKLQERWAYDEDSKGDDRAVIHIPQANTDTFKFFLQFLYTDCLFMGISLQQNMELLSLAHLYQVHGLVAKAGRTLSSKMNPGNWGLIYQILRLYQDEEVLLQLQKAGCFNYITRNMESLLKTPAFLELDEKGLCQLLQSDNLTVDESNLFQAVIRWSKYAGHSGGIAGEQVRRDTLDSLISHIRFPLMGSVEFSKLVVPSKILSDEDVIKIFMHFNGQAVQGLRFSTTPRKSAFDNEDW